MIIRGHLVAPILLVIWLVSGGLAAIDTAVFSRPVLGLALVFLPSCLALVPCQLYLYIVASRHYKYDQSVSQAVSQT